MSMRVLRSVVRYSLGFVVLFPLSYLLAAAVLSRIPVNGDPPVVEDGITVFILSNGVHTDLVLPLISPERDWRQVLAMEHVPLQDSTYVHVGFGWGDKGFYLNTPEWSDLTPGTALTAMCYLGSTAMHVTYHRRLEVGPRCRKVMVDPATYRALLAHVDEGFHRGAEGGPEWIPGHHYGQSDAFYEGTGVYGLFYTCNSWTNAGLRKAGLPACLWTPFDTGILEQYPH